MSCESVKQRRHPSFPLTTTISLMCSLVDMLAGPPPCPLSPGDEDDDASMISAASPPPVSWGVSTAPMGGCKPSKAPPGGVNLSVFDILNIFHCHWFLSWSHSWPMPSLPKRQRTGTFSGWNSLTLTVDTGMRLGQMCLDISVD